MWAPGLIGVVVPQTGAGHIRWEGTIGRPACVYVRIATTEQQPLEWWSAAQNKQNKDNSDTAFAPLCSLLANLTTAKSQQLGIGMLTIRGTSSQSSEDTHFTGYARFEKVWAR